MIALKDALMFQGKSVESAIEKALNELQLEKDDVHIEIIEESSQKLFGLARSKAKIMVSKIDKREVESETTDWEEWLIKEMKDNPSFDLRQSAAPTEIINTWEGKAWIKDSSLYFQDSETKKPVVDITDGVTLMKNGEKVEGKTALTKGDLLEIDLETTIIETEWSITVDDEKQQAILTVTPGYYLVAYLEDHPPSEKIVLKPNHRKQPNNQLTADDIYQQLEMMGINTGINKALIQEACITLKTETFIIAEGALPKHGDNGKVHFEIDLKERTKAFAEKHDGTIDFRESIYIPSIEKGELLGIVEDPTPGEDGVSVFGETLKAEAGDPILLKPGQGITYLEEENKIIAVENGRPKVERTGQMLKVYILPKLQHRGDLNLEDGNIHFVGDVEISGHVNEHMVVNAEGSAWIHKSVLHSSVQTRNKITVGANAIKSSLVAGKNSLVFEEMTKKLAPFMEVLMPFTQVVKQLVQTESFQQTYAINQSLGPVIKLLTESKFKPLVPLAKDLLNTINTKQNVLDKSWQSFAVSLYKGLLIYHHNQFKTIKDLEKFVHTGTKLLEVCESPLQNHSSIVVQYAMNSELHCNGDIHIKGKGCVHTVIHSDGNVQIEGQMIGGKLFAKEGVEIGVAGSAGGVKTLIEVPHNQTIKIKEVHPDVTLKIGDRQYVFNKSHSMVRARLDVDDVVTLY
ncbi:FapA family protein [Salipaludibacillus sp. LMS25]|uniref:flagellar assembly protein A n=1 Tax=Salipaludibacillus sp. LMS25 TaxID=2924031 RepID=UPI0020D00179|nr:flagellar assembly protein A [Salipaludibacillus sp. LMS25]UTR13369.1 FapA family protein [Salipaludibacillus sp. LMS25]